MTTKPTKVRVYGYASSMARPDGLVTRYFDHHSRETAHALAGTLRVQKVLADIDRDVKRCRGHIHVAECEVCDDHDVVEICDSQSRECGAEGAKESIDVVRGLPDAAQPTEEVVTLRNDFHHREVEVAEGVLTVAMVRQVRRALCGMDCACGGNLSERGPQEVEVELHNDGTVTLRRTAQPTEGR